MTGLDGTPFVLQLSGESSYSESYLGWLSDEGTWVNAVLGNEGNQDGYEETPFLMSYDEFVADVGPDFSLADHIGAWGRDGNAVWAVLNHNSDFAYVIPEPSSYGLLGGGFAAYLLLRRRKMKTGIGCS